MGASREIVFYENLRPVRANKIRYYEDKCFRDRVLPPPEVKAVDMKHAVRSRADDHFALWQAQLRDGVRPPPRARAAPAEVDLTEAVLPDEKSFSMDFSHVELPPGRTMTAAEIGSAVDRFLDDLATT